MITNSHESAALQQRTIEAYSRITQAGKLPELKEHLAAVAAQWQSIAAQDVRWHAKLAARAASIDLARAAGISAESAEQCLLAKFNWEHARCRAIMEFAKSLDAPRANEPRQARPARRKGVPLC